MINISNSQKPKRSTVLKALGGLLLVAVVLPFVVFAVPGLVGAEHGYVVISSSMSPAIHAGDAVIVNEVPATAIDEGDVITFIDGEQASIQQGQAGDDLITHRVVNTRSTEEGLAFKTKGDANEEADRGFVPASALVGRVMFTIPYIGHVIAYAGTAFGFIALVAIPLGLLILGEIYDLARAARGRSESDESTTEPNQQDGD
jgi:signal peptidase